MTGGEPPQPPSHVTSRPIPSARSSESAPGLRAAGRTETGRHIRLPPALLAAAHFTGLPLLHMRPEDEDRGPLFDRVRQLPQVFRRHADVLQRFVNRV